MIDEAALARLRALIESLDRICPACLAANSDEVSVLLHRGRPCPTRRSEPTP